jgi:hypothetical protein
VLVVNSGFWDIVRPRGHQLQQVYLQKVMNLLRELRNDEGPRSLRSRNVSASGSDGDIDANAERRRTVAHAASPTVFKLTLPPVMHQDDAWLLNDIVLELLQLEDPQSGSIAVLDGRNMIVNGMYLRDAQHFAAPVNRALNLELAEMLCGSGECRGVQGRF